MKLSNRIGRMLTSLFATSAVLLGGMCFTGCPNANTDKSEVGIKIALVGADTSKTWNIWAWKDAATDVNYDTLGWPGGSFQLTQTDSERGYVYTYMDIDTTVDLGILFVASSGSPQTNDIVVPKSVLASASELFFIYGVTEYYTSYEALAGIKGAQITSGDGNTVSATFYGISSLLAEDISVTGSDGTSLTVTKASLSGTKATITLSDGDLSKAPYTVTYGGVEVSAAVTIEIIDSKFAYSGDDLGITFTDRSSVTFKTWTPYASAVEVLLYASASDVGASNKAGTPLGEAVAMKQDEENGAVWSVSGVDCSGAKYYKYKITTNGKTTYVCDIHAKSASADSIASQITDINSDAAAIYSGEKDSEWGTQSGYYNPFGSVSGTTVGEKKKYTDAIIYEMHIRDWSRAENSSSTGKYLEIANGTKVIAHLKDMGVTHVQLLPVFDHAETNSSSAYNWGYNPYHYNVPEGRYVTASYEDGTQAVLELRTLIAKLHEAGIAVNMDVVYNHTSGTGNSSLYDMTVPKYFYRINADGAYANGSGCGNEVATNHSMVKKYVIDSLKHWMLDYHMNGFRFDLMGCLETSTMAEIYDALYAIDPNVMVYGEPWTGGTSLVENGVSTSNINIATSAALSEENGVACFDDTYRDAIKGKEFGGFKKGHVQGTFADTSINAGLLGTPKKVDVIGRFLNYAECHDNYTLFDKLSISYLNKTSYSGDLFTAIGADGIGEVKKQDTLAAAYVILAQGTPFLNGGQEFLRTKNGNENSYNAKDEINQILLSKFKNDYSDVYRTYKGLIALRKENSDAFGKNTGASAETYNKTKGVTKYVTGDFCVYLNASASDVTIDTTGYTKLVDVTTGTPEEGTSLPEKVSAKGFVILKK